VAAGAWSSCVATPTQIPAFAFVYVRDTDFTSLPAEPSCAAHRAAGHTFTGVYTLEPTAGAPFAAFCDMTLDGGGWTLVGRSSPTGTGAEFGWNGATGSLDDDDAPYSLAAATTGLQFTEAAIGSYVVGKAWGPNVYAVQYPAGFLEGCDVDVCQVTNDRPRTLLGNCVSGFGPTMIRRQGYVDLTDYFFMRDITQPNDLDSATGLHPDGFDLFHPPDCDLEGFLNGAQGMIMVR
jgi:hypothetical protein